MKALPGRHTGGGGRHLHVDDAFAKGHFAKQGAVPSTNSQDLSPLLRISEPRVWIGFDLKKGPGGKFRSNISGFVGQIGG